MDYLQETLQTPFRYSCDVAIAGGGTAGVVAALAAARNGARTILVDRFNFLGGSLIEGAGPLHSFFNLFKAFAGAEKVQVVRGIPQEIIDRMTAAGACHGHLEQEQGGSYDSVITMVDWEIFKEVIMDMVQEAGVQVLLHTVVAGAVMEGDAVTGIIIQGKSGREAIRAGVVIDTTGDGDVAAFAGAGFQSCHHKQGVGFPFGMANVDLPRLVRFCTEKGILTQHVVKDKGDGVGADRDCTVRLGFDLKRTPPFDTFMEKHHMWGPLCLTYHFGECNYINCGSMPNVDATDTVELTRAEILLRKQMMELSRMLIEHIPGFERAHVFRTPVHIGVRFTRAIACEYTITNDEIVNCARFEDEVMLFGFHDSAPRIMIKNGGWYGLPYRALLPKRIDGLLVAGRLITSGQDAHMSTRNTVSCMAQGQAVGTAAALCASQGTTPRALDVQLLRAHLREQGVFLG